MVTYYYVKFYVSIIMPPQYLTNSTLFDFNEISYVGRLCPELIPDITKFLPVSIFKMATTILQKIKVRICHNAKCSFKPVVSGRFGRLHSWKMATGRNFSMSGHHYVSTYQILMISDKVEFLPPIFMLCFGSPTPFHM
jgi:hypothetical protein